MLAMPLLMQGIKSILGSPRHNFDSNNNEKSLHCFDLSFKSFFLWILTSRNSYTPVDVFDTCPKVLFQLFVEQQVQLSAAHLVILPGLPLQDCILDPINFKIFLQTGWSQGQPGISNRKLTNQGSKTRALTLPKVLFNVISIDGNLAL